jgi:hypothetical protein
VDQTGGVVNRRIFGRLRRRAGNLTMPVPKGKFAAAGLPPCACARTGSFAVETKPEIVMSVTGSRPEQAVGETLFLTT